MHTGHNNYVPILKSKKGERWALSRLDNKTINRITPLIELHPHKKKPIPDHAEEICEYLEAAWGSENDIFVDSVWLHKGSNKEPLSKEKGDSEAIKVVFKCARTHLKAIPVVRLTYDKSSLAALRTTIEEDHNGYLIRVRPSDLDKIGTLNSVLSELKVTPAAGHLLLDYRAQPMNLEFDVARVPYLKQWQTFTASSGVFPRSLADLSLNKWYKIPRADWIGWDTAVSGKALKRKPAFSDYSTRDPGAPMDGGSPSVNIRYARPKAWLVRVGGKVKEGASGEMKHVCKSLISMQGEYSGSKFSAGDAEIEKTASPDQGPGNAGQWVQWGVSHHLVLTAEAVAEHV